METNFKGKGVIKWALTIGIVVVLNLFFAVAIETVYPQPDFTDFCGEPQVREPILTEEACVDVGGQWNPNLPTKEGEASGYCNEQFTCSQDYQDAREDYARNVFVVLIVLGALALLAGYLLRVSPAVSAGLSYGGVLSFIIAGVRYWGEAGDIIRLVIVGIALVALIWIGVQKFKE